MGRVYVICPDHDSPSGGVMKLYDLVDILNKNGTVSFIIHHQEGFRVTWFKNSTPVKYLHAAKVTYNDLVIIPETYGAKIMNYFPGVKKIIYNQNSYNTFERFHGDLEMAKSFYLHRDVVRVMVVSNNDFEVLKWVFPGINLSRIYHGINNKLFYFESNKSKMIALMSRKGLDDYHILANMLNINNILDGFSVQIINNMSNEECAAVLRKAAIFLSFSCREGYGLPPAEAMACGCIVIGYHGQGGKEFFLKDFNYEIDPSDFLSFSRCIKIVIDQINTEPLKVQEMGRKASDFILDTYSLVKQERSILNVIKPYI